MEFEETVYFTAGDGDPEDSLAQEPHETRALFSLPVLRSTRLPNIPSDGKCRQVMLLSDVQMLLRLRSRVGRRVL